MLENFLTQLVNGTDYNVVLADGEFPDSKAFLSLLTNAYTRICCDGATKHLLKYNIEPSIIIGDCDSLDESIVNRFNHKIIKISEQNTNDLTKAINYLHEQNLDNIIILGATGLREDHTLANIALLTGYNHQFKKVCMISQYGIFTVHTERSEVACKIGQQVSFFAINNNTKISCLELKWPLEDFILSNWSCGTLNQATAENLHIEVNDTILLYRSFEIKS